MPNKSNKLKSAKRNKKDEFYTQLKDIEAEVSHYTKHFEGKTVYCNCDDPTKSNFVKYFKEHFDELRLKRLIATCWDGTTGESLFTEKKRTAWLYDTAIDNNLHTLKGNGDFQSEECIELLKQADVVVTNPPFSLFRQYVAQLMEHDKKFLIIGSQNAITYKDVFPLIKENKMWFGPSISSGDRKFNVPDDYELNATGCGVDEDGRKYIRVKGVRWFTNLDHRKHHEQLNMKEQYSPEKYPTYDNYEAIEVSRTANIPEYYDGVMGVPITFLDKYNPDQFEIIGLGNGRKHFTPTKDYINPIIHHEDGTTANGNEINRVLAIATKTEPVGRIYYTSDNSDYLIALYARILIRRRLNNSTEHPHNAT